MSAQRLPFEDTLLILGKPRSGTTWLAKLFDSHPDVLYRHEPDSVMQTRNIPNIVPAAEVERYLPAVREYLPRILSIGDAKTSGVLPFFPKHYHGPLRRRLRAALVLGAKAAERVPGLERLGRNLPIPDFVRTRPGDPQIRLVMKSILGLGRARLYSQALKQGRHIIIVRHPCGYVASELRGARLGKMTPRGPSKALLGSDQARRRGLNAASIAAMDIVDQLTWGWVLLYEKALEETRDRSNVRVITYEDLCREPRARLGELFAWSDLTIDEQTERFLAESSAFEGGSGYFDIRRNTPEAARRWETELDARIIERIVSIARNSLPGALYFGNRAESPPAGKPQVAAVAPGNAATAGISRPL